MAAGFLRNIKDQCDGLLDQVKNGIKEEGTKKVKETALKQLPTPDVITTKFEDLASKNPKEAERYYTKTKSKLENILNGLESSRTKVESLEIKLGEIDTKINKVVDIIDIIEKYKPAIQSLLLSQETLIAVASAPGAAGAGIFASEYKIKLIGFLKFLIEVVAVAGPLMDTINKNVDGIRKIIPNAIIAIDKIISLINSLLELLEQLYINTLLPLLEGYEEIDGGINNVEDLYNQYPELESFLTGEGDGNLSDEELPYGTTNGISNVPPKFFRRYRKGPYTDIY